MHALPGSIWAPGSKRTRQLLRLEEFAPVVCARRHPLQQALRRNDTQRKRSQRAVDGGHKHRTAGASQRCERAHEEVDIRNVLHNLRPNTAPRQLRWGSVVQRSQARIAQSWCGRPFQRRVPQRILEARVQA